MDFVDIVAKNNAHKSLPYGGVVYSHLQVTRLSTIASTLSLRLSNFIIEFQWFN
jgi:hypothetical protein